MSLAMDARALQPDLTELRHTLHRIPEIGLELPRTQAVVLEALEGLDLEVTTGKGCSSVTAVLRGGANVADDQRRTVLLRGDMDALPVTEQVDVEFRSQHEGQMHACGHDLHTAMLLGAAKAMTEHPPRRDTVLAFQPGEESDRGAVPTLTHRNLQIDGQATAFALHVHALEPVGTILHRPGAFMAYGDWFAVQFTGPGGHASQPHLAGNPIEAAADFVNGLRQLTTELRRDEHVVATVTESLMGNTVNVIPSRGGLRGTIRTLSEERRDRLILGMRELAVGAAEKLGLRAEFTLSEGYPAVVNDTAYVDRLTTRLGSTELGPLLRPMLEPSMVIEDFSYFLQKWPGAMVYLGAGVPGCSSFNHSDDVIYHEDALATGAALHLLAADGV